MPRPQSELWARSAQQTRRGIARLGHKRPTTALPNLSPTGGSDTRRHTARLAQLSDVLARKQRHLADDHDLAGARDRSLRRAWRRRGTALAVSRDEIATAMCRRVEPYMLSWSRLQSSVARSGRHLTNTAGKRATGRHHQLSCIRVSTWRNVCHSHSVRSSTALATHTPPARSAAVGCAASIARACFCLGDDYPFALGSRATNAWRSMLLVS
jgi:hypothetical protein